MLLVAEATRRNLLTSSATSADVEDEIKTWLRGAPDRNGGRNERKAKASRTKSASAVRRISHERLVATERLSLGRLSSPDTSGNSSSRHGGHAMRGRSRDERCSLGRQSTTDGRSRSARQRFHTRVIQSSSDSDSDAFDGATHAGECHERNISNRSADNISATEARLDDQCVN